MRCDRRDKTAAMAAPSESTGSEGDRQRLRVVMLLSKPDLDDGRVRRQAEAAASAGHEVTVLSKLQKKRNYPKQEICKGVLYRRVKYSRYKYPILRKLPMTRRITGSTLRYVRDIEPDIIHAHDLETLPIAVRLSGRLGGRSRKSPKVLYDSHELNVDLVMPNRSELKTRYLKWLERKFIKNADAVVTVSEGIADYLETEYGIRRPTLVMNAPAVDMGRNASVPVRKLREEIGLPPDVPLAVYTGYRNRGRGLERLVSAMALVPGLHLAFVGMAVKDIDDRLAAIADGCGNSDRLHLLPPVPHGIVSPYIATADFALMPYYDPCLTNQYAMPNKLFEAVFAGLPVVTSRLEELSRFIGRTDTGVVTNMENDADIAASMKLMSEERKSRRLSADKVAELTREFGWDVQAGRLLATYDQMVHGTGCALSAAVAAELAKGESLFDSVASARRFVADGLRNAHAVGGGARLLGFV